MSLLFLIFGLLPVFFHDIAAEEFLLPEKLTLFVQEMRLFLEPDEVRYLGFSSGERALLTQEACKQKETIALSSNGGESFAAIGDGEASSWVATPFNEEGYSRKEWKKEKKAYRQAYHALSKAMRGRVMYVIPYSLGKAGVMEKPVLQITDSPLVALAALNMGWTGKDVLPLFEKGEYIKSIHGTGVRSSTGNTLRPRTMSEESFLISFLKKKEIWSYGPHITLDMIRREVLFRLFTHIASEEGWIAAHMPLFALTNPEGKTRYGLLLLPASSGVLPFFQLKPFPGWKLTVLSFDASWLFCQHGMLMAFNPEKGECGPLVGALSPSLREKILTQALFSGVAFTEEKEPWWEGKSAIRPYKLFDGEGREWKKRGTRAFFSLPGTVQPAAEPHEVVPLSMVVVITDKGKLFPLIREAASWEEGILMASLLASEEESTPALSSFDPFALRDSCGINLGDYIGNWMELRDRLASKNRCRFFTLNLASSLVKNHDTRACLPLLKWCFERCGGCAKARSTPFGLIPLEHEVDIHDIDYMCSYGELFQVDRTLWRKELFDLKRFLKRWEDRVPMELVEQILLSSSLDTLQ